MEAEMDEAAAMTSPFLAEAPGHAVLRKDGGLADRLEELAGRKEQLAAEFARLGGIVQRTVRQEAEVARRPENKPHNRYVDIGQKC
jgi:hypothetical protein